MTIEERKLEYFLIELLVVEKFKSKAIVETARAFNRGFTYHSDFLHFSHSEDRVLKRLCIESSTEVIRPTVYNYNNWIDYISNFLKIEDFVSDFFSHYLMIEGVIAFPFFEEVELEAEKEELIDIFTEDYLENEFGYFMLVKGVVKDLNKSSLIFWMNNLMREIEKKESHRLFLHYQRTIAIILFKLFDCSYDNIKLDELCTLFNATREELQKFAYQNIKAVLNCLLDFAETYAK